MIICNDRFGFISGSPKPPASYLESFNDSLRMMTATFNWLSHCRKDVVRNDVRDFAVGEMCGWDVPVGETELFPFDVTKRADEIKKTKKLGHSSYKPRTFGKQNLKSNFRPSNNGYNNSNSGYNNSYNYNKTKKFSKKPFLGSSTHKHKKKQ